MADLPEHTHVLDLLPAYAIGSLDPDELQHVEEHLFSCWICRHELSVFQMVADELGLAVPIATPSVELKDRLMQRLQSARAQVKAQVSHPMPTRPFWERLLPVWGRRGPSR